MQSIYSINSGKRLWIESKGATAYFYEQLVHDVAAIGPIPSVLLTNEAPKFLVQLIAGLCNNTDFSFIDDSQVCEKELFCDLNHPPSTVDELLDRAFSSNSRISLATSGTSGRPKWIEHEFRTLARSVHKGERFRENVWGLAYHPATFAGLQVILQALRNVNPLVRIHDLPPDHVHEMIDEHSVTHLSATPTFYRLLRLDQRTHPKVQSITVGGELLDEGVLALIQNGFPNAKIRNIYASTEAGTLLQSDGVLFSLPEKFEGLVKIVDGELVVHRSLLAESIQHGLSEEFLRTGDCVEIVSDSPVRFRFLARRTDWINVGGSKVNPHQVEDKLRSLPGIRDVRVYGRPNSVTGAIVCCDLVLDVGYSWTAGAIRKALKGVSPDYAIPRVVQVVDQIALTDSIKKERRN